MEEEREAAPKKAKPLRAQMPRVTAFLDDMREAFGVELIDGQIRQGMRGAPTFFASEGGVTIGTLRAPGVEIYRDAETGSSRVLGPQT